MILRLFRPSSDRDSIRDVYGAIVAQARLPTFYASYGVPDTMEGRFDLIVLHLVLVLARLDDANGGPRGFGQKLFDEFCRDLDDNLREMGIGDFAVPKRMRSFAEAFCGRQAVYLAALAADDAQELEKALTRNIFQVSDVAPAAVRLVRYVRDTRRELGLQDERDLQRGEIVFPQP